MHASHGVPGAKYRVGIVHQAVQRRRFFRFCPQKQYRKLNDLEQTFVCEIIPSVGTEALQERQFCRLLQRFPCREFHDVVGRFSHEVVHANFILHFGFIQKSLEPSASARFHRIKGGFERFQIGGDVYRTILEPNGV